MSYASVKIQLNIENPLRGRFKIQHTNPFT